MASIVTIEYDGTDITGHCIYEECSFEAQMAAVPGTFTVTIKDPEQTLEFITGKELTLDIDGQRLYGGFVTQVSKTYFFPADDTTVVADVKSRKWVLNGVDYNILLDKLVLHNSANYTTAIPDSPNAISDANIIRTRFSQYFDIPAGFDFSSTTAIVENVLEAGSFKWPDQGQTMRQVLDFWGLHGSVFWIDADRVFNYIPVQDTVAPWGFSDKPNHNAIGVGTPTYGFRDGEFIEDATAVINDALVWGGSEWANNGSVVFDREQNATSISAHGRWQVGEVRVGEANYKIQSEVTARAKVIVNGSASGTDPVNGTQGQANPEKQFRCTWFSNRVPESGGDPVHLRPGQVVPVWLWVYSQDDGATPFTVELPLRQLTITFPIINPDGEAYAQFQGFFGVLMSDPVWLWAFLRQSTATSGQTRTAPINTTDPGETSAPPTGSLYQGAPSPDPDGSTMVFSILFGYVSGSVQLFVNGLLQNPTSYSESNPSTGEITLSFAPTVDDELFVKAYLIGNTSVGPDAGGGGGNMPSWWVDPTTTATYLIPSSIDHTGATNVISAIQSWVDGVPDGSILEFGTSGACTYQISSSILLNGRSDLILRPTSGATVKFQCSGYDILDSAFHFGKFGGGASHISVRNFELASDNPDGGTLNAFHAGQESSSGAQITVGPSYIEIGNCHIHDFWGHGVYVSSSSGAAPDHIWIHDNAIDRVGVMGINFGVGDYLWASGNNIAETAIYSFDLEDGQAGEVLRHVYIGYNTFNGWGWSRAYTGHCIVFEGSNGMTLDDHIVEYNLLQGGRRGVGGGYDEHGDIAWDGGDTVTNLIIRYNNLATVPLESGSPQVSLDHCPGAIVQYNVWAPGGSGISASNSSGAVLTPNP